MNENKFYKPESKEKLENRLEILLNKYSYLTDKDINNIKCDNNNLYGSFKQSIINNRPYELMIFLRLKKALPDNIFYCACGVDMSKGDIKYGEKYIDVKCDSSIGKTGNLFFEVENRRYRNGKLYKIEDGWFIKDNYDYLAVIDKTNLHMYFLDFKWVQDFVPLEGRFMENRKSLIDKNEVSDFYLMSLQKAYDFDLVIGEQDYTNEELKEAMEICNLVDKIGKLK